MTRGRRILLRVLQLTAAREIARRCRVHESSVTRWLSGETTPGAEHRRMLWHMYRIPVDAWAAESAPAYKLH